MDREWSTYIILSIVHWVNPSEYQLDLNECLQERNIRLESNKNKQESAQKCKRVEKRNVFTRRFFSKSRLKKYHTILHVLNTILFWITLWYTSMARCLRRLSRKAKIRLVLSSFLTNIVCYIFYILIRIPPEITECIDYLWVGWYFFSEIL